MGLWDKIKDVALSAKCMTGWHAGEYSHIEGEPECYLGKICPDCGEYITKFNHKFGTSEYLHEYQCDTVRK